jgi:hypothetical protein
MLAHRNAELGTIDRLNPKVIDGVSDMRRLRKFVRLIFLFGRSSVNLRELSSQAKLDPQTEYLVL